MKSTTYMKGIGSDNRTTVALALALLTVISVVAIAVTPVTDAKPGSDEPDTTTGIVSIGENTYDTLQAAFDYINESTTPAGTYTVSILDDITATAKIIQTEGKNVVIEGNDHTMSAQLQIDGNGKYNNTETLTIQNLNFVSTSGDCIRSENPGTAGAYNYAHNVTIKGCDFTLNSTTDSVAMRFRQANNVSVSDCQVNGGHSMAQLYGVKNLSFDNVDIDSGRGISFGTSTPVKISNSTIKAENYGLRGDFVKNVNADVDVTGCDITASQPVTVRKIVDGATNTYSLDVSGCNLVPTSTYDAITLTTSDDEATIVAPSDDNVVVTEETVDPEPEPSPEPEPTPGYDDEEDLPPFIPTQPKDSGDDVTIVACAAAAVVAALMAVFLIVSYKKE